MPTAVVGSGGGGKGRFGFLLVGEESPPWVLDEPLPACLALLDLDLNRFMFIIAKIQQPHTQATIEDKLTNTSNKSNPKQNKMQCWE